MEALDVLAVLDSRRDPTNPPPPLPFVLGPEITLEQLDSETLQRLKFASDQAGWPPPTFEAWRGGHVDATWSPYAFVRRLPPGGTARGWDHDRLIHFTIAYSRLVRPNGVWPHIAGTLYFEDGELARIEAPQRHFRPAYVYDPDSRLWLTEDEAAQLVEVLAVAERSPLPQHGRVWYARWMLERAAQEDTLEIRRGHVVTGLESLLNTDSRRATSQFVERLPALASAVEGPPISKTKATSLYDDRSKAVHGGPTLLGPDPERRSAVQDRVVAAEDVLRRAVRLAIESEAFRDTFSTPAAVEAAYGTGQSAASGGDQIE